MTLYELYKNGMDESDERLCGLCDGITDIVNSRDIYMLKNVMDDAIERTKLYRYLNGFSLIMERSDYDAFCKEFKEVSNADNVEKETGESPFWSKEDFELWLDKVEVSYEW